MAGLAYLDTYMKNLRDQAARLASTALYLISVFAEEANRLKRKDEASRLKVLCSSIKHQMNQAKSGEEAASESRCKLDMIAFLGGLAVGGTIKMASKDKLLSALSGRLLNNLAGKQRPFGMVLVSIGFKGLPDDVDIVSISRLARESDREEPEVINKLQERGYLLLSEKTFSLLIEKLVDDVQEGRLCLPISLKELSEIRKSGLLGLESENLG